MAASTLRNVRTNQGVQAPEFVIMIQLSSDAHSFGVCKDTLITDIVHKSPTIMLYTCIYHHAVDTTERE